MAMALSDALRLPKARIIIFLSCMFLLFFLLGCDRAAEDAYGKTYGINITSPAEQKSPPSATDLHDYSTAEIAQALEGMTEGNTVVLIMSINKDNLTVRFVIAKTTPSTKGQSLLMCTSTSSWMNLEPDFLLVEFAVWNMPIIQI